MALLFNLILVAFASRESHLLALAFAVIGLLLIGLRNMLSQKQQQF